MRPTTRSDRLLTTGEFEERTGLSRKTLRGYESTGLLGPILIDPATGYRYYDVGQVRLGRLLQALREAGVPRADLGPIVAAHREDDAGTQAADTVKTLLYEQASTLREHQLDIHGVLGELHRPLGIAADDVVVHVEPAHLELVGTETCSASEIPDAVDRWRRRHLETAGPAAIEPFRLRFLDTVTEALAGRIELCLPVREPVVPPVGVSLAHRDRAERASVALEPSADPYPRIAAALEVLVEWLIEHGKDFDGSVPIITLPGGDHLGHVVGWDFIDRRG